MGTAGTVTIGQPLPNSTGATAIADGTYPSVFNNASVDPNFGVTSPIFLQSLNPSTGAVLNTFNATAAAAAAGQNVVTSFSSKSELSLNLTSGGSALTFMGYQATPNQLDISNANTPGIIEPGNTDIARATYREVAQVNAAGGIQLTTTNAYPGNNPRAVILNPNGLYFAAGNAGNGNGGPLVTAATGVQIIVPGQNATAATPGTSPVGQYNITQNGYAADKTAKDNNFRGETVFGNTLYVSKGSGGNGINTVYQVGAAGSFSSLTQANTSLLSPSITILPGFPTNLANSTPSPTNVISHPFGLFFANASTLYVADEGSGSTKDFSTTPYEAGGLQKWSLTNGTWTLDYELRGTLIGSSYTVGIGANSITTSVDGLRDLTGKVNADGTVTLYAVTSTIGSALGDAGADPNQVVDITDMLAATMASQVTAENFTVLETAPYGDVLRGVALAPNVPEPSTWSLMLLGFAGLGFAFHRSRRRAVTRVRGRALVREA
ncbi:MAG: PEP-CTERM sorting domain-containing protein [Acetobacteraceae bacterium]|nr:PEP-CTERM sorting domain-containing protein [Acetobacteraceae bacterium]